MQLPSEIEALAQKWDFKAIDELPGGHCSRVFASETQVLKVPFQGEELTYGVDAALKLQDADGPRVIRYDQLTGIVLMERLTPGTNLADSGLPEDDCLKVFSGAFRSISKLDPKGAIPLAKFADIDHALKTNLLETAPAPTFLHGDLHHFNLLLHSQEWRPIDPKGLVGDPHYECVAYLRNPTGRLEQIDDLQTFTEQRILWLSRNLNLNPWRIAAWSLIDRLEMEQSTTEEVRKELKPVFENLLNRFESHKA
jgi:streptomycin 6-kinase